ncbi:MAG: LytTR family DNA-binding domain-containing protein [Bacilli bacterium]|nr:LytTR family DNA-binding domain-containing protein [Bacilli bacterium]
MFKIRILEDDLSAAETLKDYLNQYASSRQIDIQIQHFSNAFDFLESYACDADVIFFDIEMPGMSGMEAAKKIRDRDSHVVIVFATNLAQFAIEGYSVNAFDFILKPFSYPAMELKFGRIFNELSHQTKDNTITLNRKGNVQMVEVNSILYVEVRNHSLVYHLLDKEIVTWGSLSSASEQLIPHHFAFANACYLVNLKHVKGIQGTDVIVGKEKLPISKGKRKAFLGELALYYGGTK